MKALVYGAVCAATLIVPVTVLAGSGDGGFNGVVHQIESQYHAHATRVPFMGLISLVARHASNGGVSNMHVAEFEDFHAQMDGAALTSMVEEKLGSGWRRVVRETSHNGAEQTLIFMRPEGDRMGMFVVDASGEELDVVQLSVNPEHLHEQMSHYGHHGSAGVHDSTPNNAQDSTKQ